MSGVSILAFLILMGLATVFGLSQQDPNEILRNSINTAAGWEIIPKDTRFEMKKLNGVTTSKCSDFPGGGKGCVSSSVYTSKGSSGAASSLLSLPTLIPLPFFCLLNRIQRF